jgi:hypothetical protein
VRRSLANAATDRRRRLGRRGEHSLLAGASGPAPAITRGRWLIGYFLVAGSPRCASFEIWTSPRGRPERMTFPVGGVRGGRD